MKYTRKEFYKKWVKTTKMTQVGGYPHREPVKHISTYSPDGLWEWVKDYAKKMQRLQSKACAKSYINSFNKSETVSSVAHHNIKNTPLVTEKKEEGE